MMDYISCTHRETIRALWVELRGGVMTERWFRSISIATTNITTTITTIRMIVLVFHFFFSFLVSGVLL